MDPILATGLVNIGTNIINRALEPILGGSSNTSAKTDFASQLQQAQGTETTPALQQLFAQHGVRNQADAEGLLMRLNAQLAQHPELAQQLGNLQPGEPLYLSFNAEAAGGAGAYELSNAEGTTLARLPSGSELEALAADIAQLQQHLNPAESSAQVVHGVQPRATYAIR